MIYAIVFLATYLIGSIPFGLILTKLAGLGDIRAIGSGNIGATNVLRTGHKWLAALTLLLDGAKGFVAVQLSLHMLPPLWMFLALLVPFFVVVGHVFPAWLNFRGGKGVATALGAALGLHATVGAAGMATWLIIAALFRYSSLSAIVAIAALPVYAWCLSGPAAGIALVPLSLLVVTRHKDNIKRLLNGTEPKIGAKPKHPLPAPPPQAGEGK